MKTAGLTVRLAGGQWVSWAEAKQSGRQLHSAVEAVRPNMPALEKRPRSAELELHLARCRERELQRELFGPGVDRTDLAGIGLRSIGREAATALSMGVNLLAAMATAFVVFWYLGKSAFHSDVNGIVCGGVAMVVALLVEGWLFVASSERKEMERRKAERERERQLDKAALAAVRAASKPMQAESEAA